MIWRHCPKYLLVATSTYIWATFCVSLPVYVKKCIKFVQCKARLTIFFQNFVQIKWEGVGVQLQTNMYKIFLSKNSKMYEEYLIWLNLEWDWARVPYVLLGIGLSSLFSYQYVNTSCLWGHMGSNQKCLPLGWWTVYWRDSLGSSDFWIKRFKNCDS